MLSLSIFLSFIALLVKFTSVFSSLNGLSLYHCIFLPPFCLFYIIPAVLFFLFLYSDC